MREFLTCGCFTCHHNAPRQTIQRRLQHLRVPCIEVYFSCLIDETINEADILVIQAYQYPHKGVLTTLGIIALLCG